MAVVNNYESVIVLSAQLEEEKLAETFDKIKNLIESNATLAGIDEWGKRKLAYPINDEPEGVYYLIHFSSSTDFPAELDRVCKITDGILRTLIIKKDDDTPTKTAKDV